MPFKAGIAFKKIRTRLLVGAVLASTAVGMFALDLVLHDNFHTVSSGQIYRSGQMNSGSLARAIQEHGIKSVLNLRGGGGEDWYSAETNTANQFGVKHFDIPLSATRELTDAEMDRILDTMATAPKPMLIHCKSGSDRMGLVGALYLYGLEGRPASSAKRQLTALYGHLPMFCSGTSAMDRSFWRYVSNHVNRPSADRSYQQNAPAGQPKAALVVQAPADSPVGH